MEFCPQCGTRLEPKKTVKDETVTVSLVCPKCGYIKPNIKDVTAEVKVGKVIHHTPQQMVTVIGKEEQKINTLPTIRMECPKCGNNICYVWQVQTRGGDESSTQFLRCTKCGHTFREYT